MKRYDLVVVGCGPAGERGAVQAARFGKKVLMVEKGPLPGGAMVHTGTLASKSLRESALVISGIRQRGFGFEVGLRRTPTIEELSHRRLKVADEETQRIRANLALHGVEYAQARASFVDPHVLRLEGEQETSEVWASVVLLATGTRPVRPALFPFDRQEICDSDELISLPRLPRSMVVVGAGVIGCEYASIFAALGTEVTLIDGRDRLMPFLDSEVGERLQRSLGLLGVRTRFSTTVETCTVDGDWSARLKLDDGTELCAESVLVAAGRQGNIESLGLEKAGVELGRRGLVKVDGRYRTTAPHIYAAGDLIGFPALASTSMEQGRLAMCQAFKQGYRTRVGELLPYAIYTIPECSYIGLSESEARSQGLDVEIGRAELSESGRGRIIGENGFIKLVVDASDRRLLGVHIVGGRASELVHVAQAHMMHGAKVDVFIEQIFNYPSLSEGFKIAVFDVIEKLDRRGAA